MAESPLNFPLETLALPHEDPGEPARLFKQFSDAYPGSDPIAQGLILQAVLALIELRRLARIRATIRTEKVRTAVLFWHQRQADTVSAHLKHFDVDPREAVVRLLRSGAGCRWALDFLQELQTKLIEDGTWYGGDMFWAIMIQGFCARLDQLYFSEAAYLTWMSCLALQPNPKQFEIDRLLDPSRVPKSLRERDIVLWPLDPVECRVRLQSILDRAIPAITEMEQDLKTYFEDQALAEVETMALAKVSRDEMELLRAQRLHEQSYLQATTALLKLRKQAAAERGPAGARRAMSRRWSAGRSPRQLPESAPPCREPQRGVPVRATHRECMRWSTAGLFDAPLRDARPETERSRGNGSPCQD